MRPSRTEVPLESTPELPRRDSIIIIGITTLLVVLILVFMMGSL